MRTRRDPEPDRLAELYSYAVLDTPSEQAFDDLAAAAALAAGAPLATVSLVDAHRQWVKASVGIERFELPREGSLCARIVECGTSLVAPDTRLHESFRDLPVVLAEENGIRFYAGFPLTSPAGHVLGTLCVLGPEPHELDADQIRLLGILADQAMVQLELRRLARAQRDAVAAQEEVLAELADSELRYRLLAENASDVVSRHAPDGSVLYASPSMRSVLGYEPADELGTPAPDRVHPQDRPELEGALASLAAGSGPQTATFRSRHADGGWRWLETTLIALRDPEGALLEIHSSARDVTTRVEAGRALAETEQRYRALVEQTPNAIFVNLDGRLVFANAAAAGLLGAPSPEALVGRPITDFVEPENIALVQERMAALLAGGSVPLLRQRLRRLDGSWVPVDGAASRIELDGRHGVQHVVRDASRDVAVEQAARVNAEQHRVLFERSPVAQIEGDSEGRLLRVNAAFARLVGRPQGELVGMHMRELSRSPEGERRLAERAADGEQSPVADRLFVRPDGTHVQATVSTAILREDGAVSTIVATIVDMTERNVARAELELLVRELGESRDEAEQRSSLLNAVLETIDVAVVACDSHGQLTMFNQAAREFHGLAADPDLDPADWAEHYALRAEDGVTPLEVDQVPLYRALVEGQVTGEHLTITAVDQPARIVRCDGRALRGQDGAVVGAVVAMTDVTDLRASEQRFRAAFHNGPTAMARLDADGTIRDANPALRRFLSLPTTRLLGRGLDALVHPDSLPDLSGALAGTGAKPVEIRILRGDGVPVWCELATTVTAGAHGTSYVLAQLLDVHARKLTEVALEQRARLDPLTGLGNRTVLDAELGALLHLVTGVGACVLFVDLDGFKGVNDTWGHDAGDAVLVETASRLRAAVRPGDVATRTGGDEFVIVCPVVGSPAEAEAAARALVIRLESALAEPVPYDGKVVRASASIGSALARPGDDPAMVVDQADRAMYLRKTARRVQDAGPVGVPAGRADPIPGSA